MKPLIVPNRYHKDQITFVPYRLGHKGTLCFVCHCNILKMVVYSKNWVCNLHDFETIEAFLQIALTSIGVTLVRISSHMNPDSNS